MAIGSMASAKDRLAYVRYPNRDRKSSVIRWDESLTRFLGQREEAIRVLSAFWCGSPRARDRYGTSSSRGVMH